jgi:tryptophan synthase alpha chain
MSWKELRQGVNMTGIERIQKRFSTDKEIKIMTHVVGGYPDMQTCESIIKLMAKKGVDLIEVQLPFSDPIADGPVIVHANHEALKAGVTTESVLGMLEGVRKKVDIPLLIMSYINPLFAYGIESFVARIKEIGLDGVIIPDCPPEEEEMNLPDKCNDEGLAFVPLIAPTTTKERMVYLVKKSLSPFVYAVLRLGVTGRKTELDKDTVSYLKLVKESTRRFIAAGFGIREKDQLKALIGHVECGIIGSALLKAVNRAIDEGGDPLKAVDDFLSRLS